MIATADQVQGQDIEARVNELASKELGEWIEQREFDALTSKQRQTITLAMEERGLVLSELFGRLRVKRSLTSKSPVEVCRVEPEVMFQLEVDEPRVPYANDVAFVVFNADDEEDAWNRLREYLAALQTVELNLGPKSFDDGE